MYFEKLLELDRYTNAGDLENNDAVVDLVEPLSEGG